MGGAKLIYGRQFVWHGKDIQFYEILAYGWRSCLQNAIKKFTIPFPLEAQPRFLGLSIIQKGRENKGYNIMYSAHFTNWYKTVVLHKKVGGEQNLYMEGNSFGMEKLDNFMKF